MADVTHHQSGGAAVFAAPRREHEPEDAGLDAVAGSEFVDDRIRVVD